ATSCCARSRRGFKSWKTDQVVQKVRPLGCMIPGSRGGHLFMRDRSTSARYAVAIAAIVVAFAVRYGLHGTLEHRIPFAFFTLATLIAAWYGGLGPGLLAAVGGLALTDYFFLPPHSPEGGLGETERTAIGIYAMTNALIVVLFWHLHTRLRDIEDRLRQLEGGAPVTGEPSGTPGRVHPL